MAVARLRLLLLLVFAIGGRAELPDEDDLDDDDYGPPPPPSPAGHSSGDHGSSCSFKLSTGESFDLSPMKREEHDFTGTTTGGYTYRFNVCGNTVKLCNAQPAPASKWRGTKCNNLGDPATQRVSLLDSTDPTKGVRLTYTQGDICKRQVDGQMEIGSRLINYDVFCDASEDAKLRLIREVSMCEYTIQFDSRHACPTGGVRGGPLGGRGWRLIFLIFFGAIAYLGVGVYLNGRNEGKHGVEAIPHIRHWEQLPDLVREGLQFSYVHGKQAAEIGYEQGKIGLEKGKVVYGSLRERYASLSQVPG